MLSHSPVDGVPVVHFTVRHKHSMGSEPPRTEHQRRANNGERVVLPDDAVAALSEELVLFVKLPLIFSDGHVEALLLEVRLLLLPDGGLLQHLRDACGYGFNVEDRSTSASGTSAAAMKTLLRDSKLSGTSLACLRPLSQALSTGGSTGGGGGGGGGGSSSTAGPVWNSHRSFRDPLYPQHLQTLMLRSISTPKWEFPSSALKVSEGCRSDAAVQKLFTLREGEGRFLGGLVLRGGCDVITAAASEGNGTQHEHLAVQEEERPTQGLVGMSGCGPPGGAPLEANRSGLVMRE